MHDCAQALVPELVTQEVCPAGQVSVETSLHAGAVLVSPHPAITAQRLETLARLTALGAGRGATPAERPRGVVLATARGLLQRIPAPDRTRPL